jgi:hypothetical protein
VGTPKGNVELGNRDIDWKYNITKDLRRYRSVWDAFIWFRIGKSGGIL